MNVVNNVNCGDLLVFVKALKEFYKENGANKLVDKYQKEPRIKSLTKMLYLVAMLRYVCNKNSIEAPEWLNKYDDKKISKIVVIDRTTDDIVSCCKCIKEFADKNIIETSIDIND